MSESAFIYQPQIIREAAEGLNRLDIRDDMLSHRELELTSGVDADSCAAVIRGLLYLQRCDANAAVTLYINSPGGEVQSGLALYDVMQAVSCPIRTVCLGMAASMGAFLLAGGAKGKRFALPNAEIMIHQPSGGAKGQATDIQIVAENILKTKERLNRILAENTGQPYEKVCLDTERDNYMDASEAMAYGLIDSVVTKR